MKKITNFKRRITIAQVVLSLEIGGMETVIANIVKNSDHNIYRVVVICLNKIGEIGQELRKEKFQVIKLPKMKAKYSFIFPKTLVDVLKNENIDIVHSHSGCWHKAAIGAKFAKAKGIIHTEHGRHVPDYKRLIILDRIVSKFTNYIVPVSKNLVDYLEHVVKVKNKKLMQIDNGIDTVKFSPVCKDKQLLKELSIEDNSIIIGNIGRLVPVKDHISLIKAFSYVIRIVINAKLVIVGDGPEKINLIALTEKLNLSDNVIFTGFRRDIKRLLSIFDVFVLSSISEGTPVTLLEAMSTGIPVVATNVGGIPDIIGNNKTGYLVSPQKYEEIAECIINIMKDKEKYLKFSIEGRKHIEDNYSVTTMVGKYQKLYSILKSIH